MAKPSIKRFFFDEDVDIHHIFPQDWCGKQTPKIPPSIYDSVINKTPLGYRTNRIIGGVAPSIYLRKLEAGKLGPGGQIVEPPIAKGTLSTYLQTHCIPVPELYADDFIGFMNARQKLLLDLVVNVTKNATPASTIADDEGEELSLAIAHDSGIELTESDYTASSA